MELHVHKIRNKVVAMVRAMAVFSLFAIFLVYSGAQSRSTIRDVVVHRPTVIAFFAPATKAALKNDNTNEALSDFQLYANQVRPRLEKAGVDLYEIYAREFRVRIGTRVSTFATSKFGDGYYFVAPGKKPRIERGVMTDDDILTVANEYFGLKAK